MRIEKRYQPLLFVVTMLLAFDVAYSLLSTCQQTYPAATGENSHQFYCTAFGGVIPWTVGAALHPVLHFLEAYEHPLVAGFTVVLAIFTARLWYSTEKLWNVTLRSAVTAERALNELEAPFIGLQISEPGFVSIWRGKGNSYEIRRKWNGLTFNFVNYGRTAAILMDLTDKLEIRPFGERPNLDWPDDRRKLYPYGVLVGPDKPSANSFRLFEDYFEPREGFDAIEKNEQDLFLIGVLEYRDIFGAVFEMGFCAIFNRETSGFLMDGDERYNYCRKI